MVSSQIDRKEQIRVALAAMLGTDFPNEARVLLSTLGYRSNRVLDGQSGTVDDFLKRFTAQHPDTRTEQDFRENAMSVHILFQVTDEEIAEGASLQSRMIGGGPFDTGNVKSFLFAAVELKGAGYPRGKYADFTREINRRLAGIPTAVLFRTVDGLLTIAFVHVRPNKRDPNRRVLGSISLIRAINPADPHRAHVDILAELALPERLDWMRLNGKPRNFDGLLAAWLYTLDTEELNNRFYKELFAWFERAVQEAQFPKDGPRTQTAEEHVIRLITRLMFVWFIKEKRLVADDLFIEEQMRRLLKDYDADNGDSYYRAVLQNLFFATLNTEGQREFSNVDNSTHRNFSRYRYKKEMSDPERLLVLFEQTPFINGGLFDCLDSEEATSAGGWRIDCFTDNPRERRGYSIPNRLFFDDAGLVSIFRKYKFTVEENTPAEQEVALDPELLGKVFENLLAAYNPETRENARKQTGSYYTPRAIVDYMVDEALIAALAQHAQPSDGDSVFWQDRLRYLLDYSDAGEVFDEAETDSLIRAIAGLKVLDPAVGSGAFPMGALHKLTLALRRLDPDNRRWEALQKELASERTKGALDVRDPQERNAELLEISDTFEKYRDSDFGRKLYLIQNSIYGVDLQPVACQIAKLRFFISLAIEQQINETQPNHGVKPLPNLETRFVAANTLLGLEKPLQPFLQSEELLKLERDLTANRERHFHAGARGEKLRLRDEDKRLRGLLEAELVKAEMPAPDAHRVAQWDPYDQNATADWFDAEYMFDIRDGFSIVIGNPPYVQLQKDGGKLGNLYKNAGFATFARTGDIYQLFYERGFRLLTANGVLSYITSNSWLKAEYGKATRRYIGDNHTPVRLLETGKDIFEKAIVDTSILVARSGRNTDAPPFFPAVDTDKLLSEDKTFPPSHDLWGQVRLEGDAPWSVLSPVEQSIVGKMRAKGTPLKDWDIVINYGIKTGFNDAFIIDNQTKEALVADDPRSADILKPVLRGRDIQRFKAEWKGCWLIATFPALNLNIDDYPAVKSHLLSFGKQRLEQSGKRLPDGMQSRKKTNNAWFEMQDTCAYHEDFAKEKLLWIELVNNGRFAYDNSGLYGEATTFLLTGERIKYLCAVLNTRLIHWFLERTAPTSGMGTLRWKKVYVERLPIPKVFVSEQQPFEQLVERILTAKTGGQHSDVSAMETEIDELMYRLYGLTPEEIIMIERSSRVYSDA